MHIRLPEKMEDGLRYLRLKFLPRTLFFRTMLLIFIPLIVVQVVSVVMFFDGSWSRMGRRLSENLTSDMDFVMEMMQKSPKNAAAIQKLAEQKFNLDVEYYNNQVKHKIINKDNKGNKMIIGYLESSLQTAFPNADTNIYLGKGDKDLIVLVDTDQGLYRFVTSKKKASKRVKLPCKLSLIR